MEIVRMPWIGKTLHVLKSTDSSLLDLEGTVVDETRNMIVIRSTDGDKMLSKSVISFAIDGSKSIEGEGVMQRPENRIHMKWRMN